MCVTMIPAVQTLAFVAVVSALACSSQDRQERSIEGAARDEPTAFRAEQAPDVPALQSIETAIAPPPGYERITVEAGSFGAWLRDLPVRAGRPPVQLYDGREKANQEAHYAVLDVDVGDKDLQQCADAVIRLRAEYLLAGPCRDEVQFNFTSGDTARWTDWRDGIRPVVTGNSVSWKQNAAPDASYSNFRTYLDTVFMYAGSASLEKELRSVTDPSNPEIGEVFIKGGFPGHAVIVVDAAENETGERVFLLAQSYMPAQDIHILRSFEGINPWYRVKSAGALRTPEWVFHYQDRKRFGPTTCEAVPNRESP